GTEELEEFMARGAEEFVATWDSELFAIGTGAGGGAWLELEMFFKLLAGAETLDTFTEFDA
ncbi:MAG TPA: hypothetical protein PLO51_03140, partial [Candidatus Micrarchaeota archaeon]|nr:hypothetical protein [Candidatus Micrarchaeota archaeon]